MRNLLKGQGNHAKDVTGQRHSAVAHYCAPHRRFHRLVRILSRHRRGWGRNCGKGPLGDGNWSVLQI